MMITTGVTAVNQSVQPRGPRPDPDLTSLALSTMVSRSAYAAFVLGTPPTDVGPLAATLTRLWVNALRIRTEE
jgi:hypothetical protein